MTSPARPRGAAVALLALGAALAPRPAVAQEGAEPPVLTTYGPEAPAAEGDPDHRQEITVSLPAGAGVHHVRLFDPGAGTDLDTIFGRARDTRTRFALFGAERDGPPLAQAEFGPEGGDGGAGAGDWVSLGEIDPADGLAEGGLSRFTLVVEGLAGDDGNVYSVIATPDPVGVVSGEGVALTTSQATVSIPRRNLSLEFGVDLPEDAEALVVDSFDVAGGEVAYVGPFRSVAIPSSPQGEWREAEIPIAPEERGGRVGISVSGGEETPNEVSLRVFAVVGEDRRALPVVLPPRLLIPNGRPTARIQSRALDCRRVELDAGRSTDPEAEALSYTWRFDDGSTAGGRRVERVFPGPGRYPVRLEVRDPGPRIGNGAAAETEILVKDPPAAVIAPLPRTVGVGETVTLDGSGSEAAGEGVAISRHEWLVTDGTLLQGAEVAHRFEVQGRYGVRLLVQDDSGHPCRSAAAQVVVAVNAPPRAEAGPDLRVAAGERFRLDGAASTDPDGAVERATWTIAPLDDTETATPVATLSGIAVEHAVAEPGLYRVRLTVDDGTGVSNATAEDDLVLVVNAAPIADAGPDLAVAVGELAPLDASASRDPDGQILEYVWELGNGDTVEGRTPSYAFQRPGVYEATLTVTDDSGLSNAVATDAFRVRVGPRPNAAPSADAGPDWHVMVGEPILFDASGSQDGDGNLIGFDWEFGDGRQGRGLRARHAYLAEGVYTVRLTVTDDSGLANDRATDTAEVRVRPRPNTPPVAEAGPDRTVIVGERVVFDGRDSRDPDGAILGYFWDFDDGARGRGPVITHAWRRPGVYEVALEVEDDGPRGDGVATDRATVTVNPVPNEPPIAVAGPDRVVALGETVVLDGAASSDPDGNLIAWVWSLGDGRTATGPGVRHRYGAPGVYTVRLSVQDGSGRPNDTSEDELELVVNAPPVAEAGRDRRVAAGAVVALDGTLSHDPEGELIRHDWRIEDADGTLVAEASGATAEIALETPGRYRVALTVEDGAGVANSVAEDAFALVVNAAPVAVAGPDVTVEAGEPVPFDGGGSRDPDGLLVAYDWAFGNGDAGRGPRPVYAYHEVGEYEVALTVTDDSGLANATSVDTLTVTVNPPANLAPIAEAGPDVAGVVGERLVFDGSASRDPDGDILVYTWDFGDGRAAKGVGLSHVYWAPGEYAVSLTVRDDSGRPNDAATDTLAARITPRPNRPPIAAAGSDVTVLAGERIAFDAAGSSDPDGTILDYTWEFGDGATARGQRVLYVYRTPGTYTVRLAVRDDGPDGGAEAEDTVTVTVEPNPLWSVVASDLVPRSPADGGADDPAQDAPDEPSE